MKHRLLAVIGILTMLLSLLFNTGAVHAQTMPPGTVVGWGNNTYGQSSVPVEATDAIAIAAGGWHSLALKADGTVIAWGDNNYGQSMVPSGLSGVTAIAAGGWHSLALKADGTVVAWGYNGSGQSIVPSGLIGVTAIAAGGHHSLALKADGTVIAWGYNGFGEGNVPAGLSGVTAIAAGSRHSLALKADGTVVAWGDNEYGQSTVPSGLTNVTAIAGGDSHSLALKADGTVVAWGNNNHGQSTVLSGLSGVIAIAAGVFHNLALKADGTVVAWGNNNYGQSTVTVGLSGVTAIAAGAWHNLVLQGGRPVVAWGWNNYGQTSVPAGLSGVTATAAGYFHSLALKADGTVVAWGRNTYGQATVPAGLTNVTAVAAGGYHSLALKSDGTVVAWGDNNAYQTSIPAGLSGVTAIDAGADYSLALKADGTVAAWGWNDNGQTSVPAGLSDVIAIAAGHYHNMALKSDGTIVAWGRNVEGQTNIPAGLSDVIAIAAGFDHNMALKSDGTIVAWGNNNVGQISVPAGLSGVIAVAAGSSNSLALKSDRTVVAWGANGVGQASVPAGLSGVTDIDALYLHSMAVGLLAPAAQGQSLSTDEDTALAITMVATDVDNDPLTYSIITAPAHGTLSGTAPNVTYTPNTNWNGSDSFTFKANDGLQDSNVATVTITVNPVNDVPVAVAQSVATPKSTPLVITLTATDPENSALTYTIVTGPDHGTLSGTVPSLTYTPNDGYAGDDFIYFSANDGELTSNVAMVNISVFIVSHHPSAIDDSYSTNQNTALAVAAPGVLSNDTDEDGDPISAVLVSGPAYGTLTLNADGSFTYTPAASYAGTDSFTYKVNDGELASNIATVSITVSQTNTAPTANPGGPYLGAVNTSISFDGSLSSDPENDPLTYAWTLGDGATGTGAAPTHTYIAAGVYNVCLTVNDGSLDSPAACTLAVIYDPSAGFVTGGGWIDSPAGAYKADETLAGKATFGFVSKYQRGASVPTGTTAFEFDLAGLAFSSQSYEWLVVNRAGTNAQFKGTGLVNGAADPNGNAYKFVLWAGDGSPDTFRIRIWWEDAAGEHDLYDNGTAQAIGAGNIVVHTGK